MRSYPINISPFGEFAVIVQWPEEVSEQTLNDILAFQETLKEHLSDSWEYIPAYNSLTLVNIGEDFDYRNIKKSLNEYYGERVEPKNLKRFLWKLPVCYDEEFAMDMEQLEEQLALSKEDIVHLHTSHEYTVYGIGFLPGFMYLGGLPKVLETRRRDQPRLKVEKGSVGLAAKQTGIYPQDSPGGWNIIGKCPVPIFNLKAADPCFVNVGDKVQFVPIKKAAFDLHQIEAEVGILQPEKVPLDA